MYASRFWVVLLSVLVVGPLPALGQVVESVPNPARTDQSVTITFYADRGSGGLEDCDCEVYAHTGLITEESTDDSDWRYVMDEWPENRELTKLEQIDTNTYELTIDDIREYYSKNNTDFGDVPPKSEEEIRKMAFVFRNSDGSKTGKTEGGDDIFVEVNDVEEGEPFLSVNLLSPDANPPLYPFMAASDTTVNVTVTADTSSLDSFSKLRLFVDGDPVDSTAADSLTYGLEMNSPNRFDIRADAEAEAPDTTLRDTVTTSLIRTPEVVEEPRPSGIEDGINYDPNDPSRVTLSLKAPRKEFVYAIGDFSNWEIDDRYFMKRDGDHWWITLEGLSAARQYDFQYFVDGEIRTSDPFSHKIRAPADVGISEDVYPGLESYPGDKTENFVSVIRPGQQNDSFEFSAFDPPEREDLVVYELLMRDFVEESSFKVLKDTLAYLDRLGVNAVELMPVANFGGNSSWGYNPNAHLALDKSYGTPEGFKEFVEEAHSRGIAVIMDVVYNHITDQSPLVQLYSSPAENPFIVKSPADEDRGFCDDFFRELDQTSPFIQKYIDRANEYWLEEFNVDGFRFDLAKCVAADFNDPNYSEEIVSGWKEVSDHVWNNVNSDAYMILEFFGSPSVENELGGYRADETGSMMTWHNMNGPYSEADMGFVGDSGSFSSSLSDTYYGNRGGYDQPSFIAYMESHDEQWLMRKKKEFGNESGDYSTKELETALNRQKLSGAFYFTVPGPRMTWQFGELGYGWGEGECLKDGGGGEGPCAASDPGRTSPKPIRWDYRDPEQSPARVKLYKAWSALLDLRNQHEVFTSLQTDVSMKVGDDAVGRRIVLEHESMDAVVFGNFGVRGRAVRPQFPASGTWYDYFTGTEIDVPEDGTDRPIPLAPGEFHVLTSEPVDFPEAGLVPFERLLLPPAVPSTVEGQAEAGEVTVSWSESTSSDLTEYVLYRGQSANFDTTGAQVARLDAGVTSYTDSEVSAGQVYYYRLVALDSDGLRSVLSSPAQVLVYPQTLSFDVSRSFDDAADSTDYRLVALPGDVERPLAQTLSGEAGDTWQAYWDNGTDSDFFVQFDGSSTFTLEPGRGFWLISDSSWSVQAEDVSTVALEEGRVATIDLHSGWNIISNPFDRGVSWDRVGEVNSQELQPLWAFAGGFSQAARFSSARSGEAYYFLNNQDLDQLTIPYSLETNASRTDEEKTASQDDGAILTLEVGRGETWDSAVQVGWKAGSDEGLDPADWIAPPSRFASLSLWARAESAPSSRQQLLARSVRPRPERGESFSLTLRSAAKEPVRLRATGIDAFSDREIRLVDKSSGVNYDLRKEEAVRIEPRTETASLTLLVGTENYVQSKKEALTASELALRSGHPNPFRQKTTLTYTLPEEGPVKFEVFDVLGRRVRVLVDERKKAGAHQVTWNGGNRSGRTVASGVYLGRLTFGGKTITQKMVLVK